MATEHKTDTAVPVYAEGALTTACWSCGDMRAAHFCESCGKLQPACPTDYFSFFGLPRKLNLDAAALEREFYRLSRKLHPDLYVQASPKEQRWSLEKSSQLNDAYRTLRDPIARTAYLLKIEGMPLEEQSQAASRRARESDQDKKQGVPPDLLEEVFELNLQLEELRLSRQAGGPDTQLREALCVEQQKFEHKLQACAGELAGLFDEWDALPFHADPERESEPSPERTRLRERMLDLLNRRKYIGNLVEQISEALES